MEIEVTVRHEAKGPPLDPQPSTVIFSGRILKWSTRADCKSAGLRLRRFESFSYHHLWGRCDGKETLIGSTCGLHDPAGWKAAGRIPMSPQKRVQLWNFNSLAGGICRWLIRAGILVGGRSLVARRIGRGVGAGGWGALLRGSAAFGATFAPDKGQGRCREEQAQCCFQM
jgi:hypothetical protein